MLDILYRDEQLVAIHKPAGLLVHRSDLDRRETRFAVQLLRDQIGHHVFPAHRLDRGTSGVLLFALDPVTAGNLGRQFETNAVDKRYLAVLRGWPVDAGIIDHALTRQFDDFGRKLDAASRLPPQPAVTAFRRLAQVEIAVAVDRYARTRYSLVELVPQTGRQHQLRRHMKHIAHPIIGDATWGKGIHNRFVAALSGIPRLMLASTGIRLRHPDDGRELSIDCAPSPDFISVATALGLRHASLESIAQ